jgi:hypothetical protein
MDEADKFRASLDALSDKDESIAIVIFSVIILVVSAFIRILVPLAIWSAVAATLIYADAT